MNILGIAGKSCSGKNTIANLLVEIFKSNFQLKFYQVAFADYLKLLCKSHFKLSDEQVNGNKKEMIDLRFQKRGEGSNVPAYWTPREIMQGIGAFYRSVDCDFWITKLKNTIDAGEYGNVIITDVRYENECEYVKNSPGGFLIKIIRSEVINIHGMDHASETSLDQLPDDYFDLIVNNNGSLEDLKNSVPSIVEAIMVVNKLKNEGGIYNAKR